jgi:hypothetical protein
MGQWNDGILEYWEERDAFAHHSIIPVFQISLMYWVVGEACRGPDT